MDNEKRKEMNWHGEKLIERSASFTWHAREPHAMRSEDVYLRVPLTIAWIQVRKARSETQLSHNEAYLGHLPHVSCIHVAKESGYPP